MRSKNKELMNSIVDYINDYYRNFNEVPTIRKISDKFNLAKSSVQRYLVSMNDSGMITYANGKVVTDFISKFSLCNNYTPLVGSIPCGNPNEEEEIIEEYVNLPESIFGTGNYYILKAKGVSMVDEGIDPGDSLVIETSNTAKTGDIVVALDDDRKNTLKKYGGYDSKNKCYKLLFCNEAVYPGKYISVPYFEVQGVLKYVIKEK